MEIVEGFRSRILLLRTDCLMKADIDSRPLQQTRPDEPQPSGGSSPRRANLDETAEGKVSDSCNFLADPVL